MPASVSFTRPTFTEVDTLSSAQFNNVTVSSATVPDATAGNAGVMPATTTAAGLALVTAANVAAQRTLLSVNNVDNTSDANKPVSTAQQAALDLKANLASPALSGTPTAPTASTSTNSTQIATTAFVQAVIAALIAAAPGALDTLDELAAAMGDDANFAATVTSNLATKMAKASNLADLTNVATARSNLGLGTAALAATGDFDAAGAASSAAAAAQAAAIAASCQRSSNLSDVANAATARGNLGVGSNGVGNRTVSTGGPSGGSDGDIHLQV